MNNAHTRLTLMGGGLLVIAALMMTLSNGRALLGTDEFAAHGYCITWEPILMRAFALSDLLIGLSYFTIAGFLVYLVAQTRREIPFNSMFLAFGGFIFFCGLGHFVDLATLFTPFYRFSASVRVLTALVSVATAVAMPYAVPRVIALVRSAQLSEARKKSLVKINNALQAENAERARIEEELRIALDAERQLSAFRANIVSRISHEFRTPLATIRTAGELLLNYFPRMNDEQRRARLMTIEQEIDRLTDLLDDILTVGKLQNGSAEYEAEGIDLPALAQSVVDAVSQIEPQRAITLAVNGAPQPLHADATTLALALRHVLYNALRYSPPDGPVRLQIDFDEAQVMIAVRDHGLGIPLEDQPHVFDLFYRGGNVQNIPGTGVGLHVVKQSIEALGGSVALDSLPDDGTTITLKLPMQPTLLRESG